MQRPSESMTSLMLPARASGGSFSIDETAHSGGECGSQSLILPSVVQPATANKLPASKQVHVLPLADRRITVPQLSSSSRHQLAHSKCRDHRRFFRSTGGRSRVPLPAELAVG